MKTDRKPTLGDTEPRYWGIYWKTPELEKALGTPLDEIWSAQFKRVREGDEVWIWGFLDRPRRFVTVGRLIVGAIEPNPDPTSNRLTVRAKQEHRELGRKVDLSADWPSFRSHPSGRPLSDPDAELPDPRSLQTMRGLTEASRKRILQLWNESGLDERRITEGR